MFDTCEAKSKNKQNNNSIEMINDVILRPRLHDSGAIWHQCDIFGFLIPCLHETGVKGLKNCFGSHTGAVVHRCGFDIV